LASFDIEEKIALNKKTIDILYGKIRIIEPLYVVGWHFLFIEVIIISFCYSFLNIQCGS